jgi:hypothetical protein
LEEPWISNLGVTDIHTYFSFTSFGKKEVDDANISFDVNQSNNNTLFESERFFLGVHYLYTCPRPNLFYLPLHFNLLPCLITLFEQFPAYVNAKASEVKD